MLKYFTTTFISSFFFICCGCKEQKVIELVDNFNYKYYNNYLLIKESKSYRTSIVIPTNNNAATDSVIWEYANKICYAHNDIMLEYAELGSYMSLRLPVRHVPFEELKKIENQWLTKIHLIEAQRDSMINQMKLHYKHNFHPRNLIVVYHVNNTYHLDPYRKIIFFINKDTNKIVSFNDVTGYRLHPLDVISRHLTPLSIKIIDKAWDDNFKEW